MDEFSRQLLRSPAKAPGPPVNDLPPELLAQVLELATDTEGYTLDLCTVCKIWHGVILSHPIFWTSLHISVRVNGPTGATDHNTTISAKLVAQLDRWFGRAGDLPMDVSIDLGDGRLFEPTESFHQYLVRNPRWRAFRLEGLMSTSLRCLLEAAKEASHSSPCWPILQHFVLKDVSMLTASGTPAPPIDGTGGPVQSLERIAPRLKEYTLTSDIIHCPWLYPLCHPVANVTTIEIEGLGIACGSGTRFVTYLLSKVINLKRLRLQFLVPWKVAPIHRSSPPANLTPRVVSHPNLEELSIGELAYSAGSESLFTQYLRLPRLRVLDLSTSKGAHLPLSDRTMTLYSIVSLVQNSNCELKHLSLDRFATSSDDLLRALAQIGPSLKSLQLHSMIYVPITGKSYYLSEEWGASFLKTLRDARRAGQSALPDLETFDFAQWGPSGGHSMRYVSWKEGVDRMASRDNVQHKDRVRVV